MLAKLKSDGWRSGGTIVLLVGVSLLVGLLVWFILGRGDDSQSQTPVADVLEPVPLPLDDVGVIDGSAAFDDSLGVTAEPEVAVGTDALVDQSSKAVDQPETSFSWSGWQLQSIDGVELTPVDDTTVRCRTMSTDRIPNRQVVGQLIYQIGQTDGLGPQDFHISQINNYYRCDLDLVWSAIIVGYEDGVCLDLGRLNGALSLTTGRGDQAQDHPALAPWIVAGSGCSASPGLAGRVGIEVSQSGDQPTLAEVTYQGTFRVFVPKNDYSKIVSSIQVELEPGVYGILKSVRIERL